MQLRQRREDKRKKRAKESGRQERSVSEVGTGRRRAEKRRFEKPRKETDAWRHPIVGSLNISSRYEETLAEEQFTAGAQKKRTSQRMKSKEPTKMDVIFAL